MHKYISIILSLSVVLIIASCNFQKSDTEVSSPASVAIDKNTSKSYLDYEPICNNGDVNALIEIPSGTIEKWELNKESGELELEMIDNAPRIINYLGYPANYGMIPRTLLPKEFGGDGDPLDIIVLGPPAIRGDVIKCKVVGIIYLSDRGEQDDKLIAISCDSPLYDINSIDELNAKYFGLTNIIELWFTNYKGPDKVISNGFGDRSEAMEILNIAIESYKN